jgi:hypothetical protein
MLSDTVDVVENPIGTLVLYTEQEETEVDNY